MIFGNEFFMVLFSAAKNAGKKPEESSVNESAAKKPKKVRKHF